MSAEITFPIDQCNSTPRFQPKDSVSLVDEKIRILRDQTLRIIRTVMPIEKLFTPELKINLRLFTEGQILFQQIAEFISPLKNSPDITVESIAKYFEGSKLLDKINTANLNRFYEACIDVLNGKEYPKMIKSALEGRIYTLKNALIAQDNPQAIRKSQVEQKISPQNLESIVQEGASFLRESLRLHMESINDNTPFQSRLALNVEQLIPFVQKVTKIFLKDNDKSCPENPLTFRNPTGYNHHGLIAATIMESCLNVLGYSTRILIRSDLEPKVTLATAHSIVEVNGPDNKKYIIDTCYLQFHVDASVNQQQLPKANALVLDGEDTGKYIDENLMTHWKTTKQLVSANDSATMTALKQNDQLLSFIMEQFEYPEYIIPSNIEAWVRESFIRVWDLSSYQHVLSNAAIHEIFYGENTTATKTYELVKSMEIAQLTYHQSYMEVERQLNLLLNNPSTHGKNLPEALSLIAQLPTKSRDKYKSLLDIDPRLSPQTSFSLALNAYFRSLRKVVNPEGVDKRVIYGCSGADAMSVLLSTDANEITFVDLTHVRYEEFQNALNLLKNISPFKEPSLIEMLDNSHNFVSTRRTVGGSSSAFNGSSHHMQDLPLKLLFDLREIGVDLSKIELMNNEQEGVAIRIEFPWKYHGVKEARNRSITYVMADITQSESYPKFLKETVANGFDIFYMKGSFIANKFLPQFLPLLANSLTPGGWLMTTDRTFTMETSNPEICLKEKGLLFSLRENETIQSIKVMMDPPFDPLCSIRTLDYFRSENRHNRTPGSNLTYWAVLNLRQKN